MKLIGKLSKEYMVRLIENDSTGTATDQDVRDAFEAGMRKMREIAKETSYHASDCDRRCSSDCNIQIGDRIAELGEEEV